MRRDVRPRRWAAVVVGAAAATILVGASPSGPTPGRLATVQDVVERAVFVTDSPSGQVEPAFSPDGTRFFVITRRGVLRSDETEATLWLFDRASVVRFLRSSSEADRPLPRALVRMATSSNEEPITRARWSADGRSIAFLGRPRDSERHLYVVRIEDGGLNQLTGDGQDVTGFDRADGAADSFLLTVVPAITASQLYQSAGPSLPDQVIGTGRSLFQLLYPEWESFTFGLRPRQVLFHRAGKTAAIGAADAPISLFGETYSSVLALSPSGRYAVVTTAADRVPPDWESYPPAFAGSFTRIIADKPGEKPKIDFYRPLQYELIDIENGKISVLVDAPLARSAGYPDFPVVAWSRDEREVALGGTFLPHGGPFPAGTVQRPCVAVVEISTRRVECVKENGPTDPEKIYDLGLTGLEWRKDHTELRLKYSNFRGLQTVPSELFRRQGNAWRRVVEKQPGGANRDATGDPSLVVSVRQTVNDPPVLAASLASNGRVTPIWDPNPELAGVRLGQATVYRWRDQAGREWKGGLVKPPDYVAGRRYPLVVQTHGFREDEFLMDGIFPTANSARAMAARGIVVLQVGEITTDAMATPREPFENGTAGYVAVVERLVAENVVDPRKVGVIAFSRTGWYVLDSLIHRPELFAAATLAECTSESYYEYLMNADYLGPQRAKGIAEGIGPDPVGAGLARWISDSPGFNLDKIRVPVLFEEHSPVAMMYSWDLYAAMRLQAKPVELLYFRNGEHILFKPRQLLASQEMNVDWFDFWLNGHEDPDPSKAEQYVRWRALRTLRKENK